MKEATYQFTAKLQAGKNTIRRINDTWTRALLISSIAIKGENLRLISVQVGVSEYLYQGEKEVGLRLATLQWFPLLDLFVEIESPGEQEIEVTLEGLLLPGETGFESSLD